MTFTKFSLKSTQVTKLGVANGSSLSVLGKAVVDITVGSKKCKGLNLVITDSTLVRPLLDREWLDVINPLKRRELIKSIHSVGKL